MKLIIAGCRNFNDRFIINAGIDAFIEEYGTPDVIIEGGARGVDRMAYYYAKDNGIPVKVFPADWNKYGRAAGPIRNSEMAKYGTHLLAFWDGKSRGTKNMIETAKKHGLIVTIISCMEVL